MAPGRNHNIYGSWAAGPLYWWSHVSSPKHEQPKKKEKREDAKGLPLGNTALLLNAVPAHGFSRDLQKIVVERLLPVFGPNITL